MSYNIKKITREWNRQHALQQSWQHIHSEMTRLQNRCSQRENYVIGWCKQELSYLRRLNGGFSWTKPERAVLLLMRRTQGGKDPISYSLKQLKIQSSSYLD